VRSEKEWHEAVHRPTRLGWASIIIVDVAALVVIGWGAIRLLSWIPFP
jgi:hypothetical protein